MKALCAMKVLRTIMGIKEIKGIKKWKVCMRHIYRPKDIPRAQCIHRPNYNQNNK
jgi:hypothetical protein